MLKSLREHSGLIVCMVLVLLIALPILSYPMGRDQGMYANIGNSILSGGIPFVDMWDIKPPPIYYIYAAGIRVFRANTLAIRALDLVFVPIGMLGLYLLGSQMKNRTVGTFAALLYGVFYFNDGFQNLSQSDSLATVPVIWAAYFSYRAVHEAGYWQTLMVGLISGILLWFKPQQYALIVGAFVLYFIISALQNQHKTVFDIIKHGTVFAIGGLLTGGTLLAYFWSVGIIGEILIVADGTAAYNAQGYDLAAFAENMRSGFYFRWTVWHGLIILSGLWIISFLLSHLSRRDREQQPENLLLILWFVAGLGFAFVQAKGFDTHWFPLLPVMALMGAAVIVQVVATLPQKTVIYGLIMVGLVSIPTLKTWGGAWEHITGQATQSEYWDTFQANDLKPEQSLAMATYLRERVQSGDSLFIWGFRPEVYFMADLRPATRYQAHFPLVAPWYPETWQQNNVDILWAAMPPYALILEDDFMPWVTDFDADSHTLLQDYTELNNWLIANYEREEQIGDFIIWKRRSP